MGDELNGNLQTGQAGQPVTPSSAAGVQSQPPAPEGPAGNEPQYVTKEEALKLAKEAAQDALRQAQSMTDKSEARIRKEVERLSANGITATPEQVKKMIAAEEAQSQSEAVAAPQAAPPATETIADPVVRKAYKIMEEEAGARIPMDAPEFKLIDPETDDPEVFLASVRTAAKAFKERTGNLANPARIPSLGSGSETHAPSHAGKSGADTLDQGYKDLGFG